MGVGSLFPWGPPPSMPTSPSEPSLRPCIQGAWVLPPGAALQAQTSEGDPTLSQVQVLPRRPQLAPQLPASSVAPCPSQVGTRAHVTPSAPPRPCNHSRTRTTSWPRLPGLQLPTAQRGDRGTHGPRLCPAAAAWGRWMWEEWEHWETKGRNGGSPSPIRPQVSGLDLSRPWEESWHRAANSDAQAGLVPH